MNPEMGFMVSVSAQIRLKQALLPSEEPLALADGLITIKALFPQKQTNRKMLSVSMNTARKNLAFQTLI
ncbi:hypothetical protein SDC9_201271 [bioreactor metagenome]|uniref:Uncharacterized protein n=1 Tax=bioreactor metagenome TaxID=1076179 RepID=A0A645IQU0_9ZZZZ